MVMDYGLWIMDYEYGYGYNHNRDKNNRDKNNRDNREIVRKYYNGNNSKSHLGYRWSRFFGETFMPTTFDRYF
jgi:hypothetical protein